jgi:hypothetical protein
MPTTAFFITLCCRELSITVVEFPRCNHLDVRSCEQVDWRCRSAPVSTRSRRWWLPTRMRRVRRLRAAASACRVDRQAQGSLLPSKLRLGFPQGRKANAHAQVTDSHLGIALQAWAAMHSMSSERGPNVRSTQQASTLSHAHTHTRHAQLECKRSCRHRPMHLVRQQLTTDNVSAADADSSLWHSAQPS